MKISSHLKNESVRKITNLNPLSAKFIKWSNTLIQIVGKLPTICLSVFDHFSGLALKGLSVVLKKGVATFLERLILYLISTPLPNHRIHGKT